MKLRIPLCLPCLFLLLLFSPPQLALAKKSAKNAAPALPDPVVQMRAPDSVPEKIKQELVKTSKTLVGNAAKSIVPNKKSKAVAQGPDGSYLARYTEVDTMDIRAEIIPSSEAGKYVGSIRYVEKQYECQGKNKADALQAECRPVKSRRMNELIRYEKGKWHY